MSEQPAQTEQQELVIGREYALETAPRRRGKYYGLNSDGENSFVDKPRLGEQHEDIIILIEMLAEPPQKDRVKPVNEDYHISYLREWDPRYRVFKKFLGGEPR